MADLSVHQTPETPQEPEHATVPKVRIETWAGNVYVMADEDATTVDYLTFIKTQCEHMPDTITDTNHQLWLDGIAFIFGAVDLALDDMTAAQRRDGDGA